MLPDIARSDLGPAVRVLRRSPVFTATSVMTLAIAIGACTAVFSLADALLFAPPPYPEPGRLAFVEAQVRSPRGSGAQLGHDTNTWEAVRDGVPSVDAAVYSGMVTGVNLVVGTRAAFVAQRRVGAGYFRVLGVHPAPGREFSPEEDVEGGPAVAVISHGLWTGELGARPDIVGETILLRGEAHTVIGVMPAEFDSLGEVDVWTPLRPSRRGEGGGTNFQIAARLGRQATWDQVNAELAALGMEPLRTRGIRGDDGTTAWLEARPMQEVLADGSRAPILMLAAAAVSVLAIGCLNIAALVLSRASGRAREVATRLALGASRAAVVRRLMAESLLIGIAGGLVGIAVARLGLSGLQQLAATTFGQWQAARIDFGVLVVAAALALGTSVLFGLFPALQASRLDVSGALAADGSRSVAPGARAWPRRLLVAGQVAVSVTLLVLTALLVRTVANLAAVDPGFAPDRLVTASVSLQDARYETEADVVRLVDESLRELRSMPGIEAAAVSLQVPYTRLLNWGFRLADDPDAPNTIVNVAYVSDGFFETYRIPVREGRAILRTDRSSSPPVVVVNETFARVFAREGRVMRGRPFVLSGFDTVREIVGIAGDVQQTDSGFQFNGRMPGPVMATPTVYLPVTQVPASFLTGVHTWFRPVWTVRPRQGTRAAGEVARAIARVDPLLPVSPESTIDAVIAGATAEERLLATLVGLLGTVAILLAALGLHGLVAQAVADRRREIAIRLALGATPGRVVARAASSGVVLAGVGAVLGGVLSLWAVGFVQSFLWGVEARDPVTIAGAGLAFIALAAAASVLPAMRILRLDPVQALRS